MAVAATGFGLAHAEPHAAAPAAVSETEIPSLLENFSYPGSAAIKADSGITLKRGDGRINLIACEGVADIKIISRTGDKTFCFDVKAKPAYVTLELPDAYGITTAAYPVRTTIKADGKTDVIEAPANDFTGYGEAGASRVRSTLIELRVLN